MKVRKQVVADCNGIMSNLKDKYPPTNMKGLIDELDAKLFTLFAESESPNINRIDAKYKKKLLKCLDNKKARLLENL